MATREHHRPHLPITPRLVVLALVLGGIGGLAALGFSWLIAHVQDWTLGALAGYEPSSPEALQAEGWTAALAMHPMIPVVTGLGGLVVGLLVFGLAPEAEGHGTDAVVDAYHRKEGRIRARVPWVKGVASAITIGTGGAAGREGPTAQIAAGLGSVLASVLKLGPRERRSALLMGMAAGLSAIFRSPLGTAIFAVEVVYSSIAFEAAELVYTLLAAATAYAVMQIAGDSGRLLSLPADVAVRDPAELLVYVLLGLVCGTLAAVLPWVFYRVRDLFHRLPLWPPLKPALGGVLVGVMGMFLPPVLGGGYEVIQLGLNGGGGFPFGILLALALAKMIALSLTVGSGGSGGVFAPSLYVGALTGAGIGGLALAVGLPASVPALTAVGMAALFAGAARVPIATMVMVAEMTGGYALIVPSMVAVAIAVLLQSFLTRRSAYPSMYEAQVPTPGQSPVHREEYYRVTAELLRKRLVQLEETVLGNELVEALKAGRTIPIGDEEVMGAMHVPETSSWVGRQVRDVATGEVVFVAVRRGDAEIVPRAETVFRAGDTVVMVGPEPAVERAIQEQGATTEGDDA